jgi:Tol biopolymer transport system component
VAELAHWSCDAEGVGLAVDAGGNAHLIAGVDKEGAVYIGQVNGAWGSPQTIYEQITNRAVMAVDREGRLHVVLWPKMVHLIGTVSATTGTRSQVEGQVVDEGSGQPLAGAEVTIGQQKATTDADGYFAVAVLAPGPYAVLVSAEGYDPILSGIVAAAPGQRAVVNAALPAVGQGEYPRDPMASNQIDPAGAPSAQEAERLARVQGLQGDVTSIREVVLDGEYLVNYRKESVIHSAAATLNHPGWELVDAAGQSWYVVRVCGNLAVARQAAVKVPAQVMARPYPVVTVSSGGAVGRACSAESCGVVAQLPAGWHGTAVGCSPGCGWLQVQGPGVSGTCWVRADLVQFYGEVAGLSVASPPPTARIAYEKEGDVWLINSDGSHPTRLTNVGSCRSPAWSPDGRNIAVAYSPFDYMTIPSNLHIIEVDTGQATELTHYTLDDPRPVWITSLEWSPDGSTIVYMQTGDGLGRYWNVVSIGSDGSNPGDQLPIEQGHNALYPAWAPDGKRITYGLIKENPIITRPADNFGIWVVGIDGRNARQLTTGSTGISSWSADGAWIAYDSSWGLDRDVYIMRGDGTASRKLTSGGISFDPHWSPDGSQIVFVRIPEPGAPEIWLMDADGSNPRKLTDGSGPAWQPVALPATPGSSATPSPSSAIPGIRWTAPEVIGDEGQGGPTQQLLLDHQGRLWAIWEEHVAWQPPDRGYDAVHYRVWADNAWGDLRDIPGSDNYGEPTATLLPNGRILVKAETTTVEPKPYLWFQWDGSQWSTVPEMESLMPLNEGIRSIAADSRGLIHLMAYPIRTWDGTSWREGQKLGTILFHATALDPEGVLHAVGSAFAQGSSQGIRKWTWDGTSWSASGDVYKPSSQEDSGYSPPALAIGPDGTFHVVWAGSGPLPRVTGATPPRPFWISYSRGHGDHWSQPQTLFGPVTVDTGYRDTDLAVAPDGTVIVVWGDVKLGPGYRAYATWGKEGQWAEPIVLSPEDGDEHMWPVVAMDAEGRVHIIWKARKGIYHVMGIISK